MREVPFVPANLNIFAKALLECFRNRRIELYPNRDLIRDLERISIIERPFGYKLDSIADEEGHADRATALVMLLPAMMAILDTPIKNVVEPMPTMVYA